MPASPGRISFSIRPLWTDVISTLFGLVVSRHSATFMQGNLGDPRPFTARKYFRYKYFRQYCMEYSSI